MHTENNEMVQKLEEDLKDLNQTELELINETSSLEKEIARLESLVSVQEQTYKEQE